MKKLGAYINGNYTVTIYDDGTKIRRTNEDEFIASFPESFDCKITNQCDLGCVMCHENSTFDGKHGDILNPAFINTLKPFTEIAIGGGNPLAHPDLIQFLQKLKDRKVLASMTVNQIHFMKSLDTIKYLADNKLINGIGVSLMTPSDEFIKTLRQFDNAVLHIINGMLSKEDIDKLKDNDLKILILGYKQFRRGINNYDKNSADIESKKTWLSENLKEVLHIFKVVSFDNLAIEQLNVQSIVPTEEWDEFYMGDDGTKTLYVDLVSQQFASCSVSNKRHRLMDNMEDMFKTILNENTGKNRNLEHYDSQGVQN